MSKFRLTGSNRNSRGLVRLLAATLAAFLASGCVGLTGDGESSGSNLTASPASIGFGDVTTGNAVTRSVIVTNAGPADVAVDKVSISGAGFNAGGVPAGLILAPGDKANLNVTFAPSSTGKVTGTVTVAEKSFPVPTVVTVSGTGVAPGAHSVTLTWNASGSSVAGYRAYRATSPGGPYSALNSAPNPQLQWKDSTVQSGATYYYVVTSVAADKTESAYSNQASAAVPKP